MELISLLQSSLIVHHLFLVVNFEKKKTRSRLLRNDIANQDEALQS